MPFACASSAGFETDDMGIVKAETHVLLYQWPFAAVEKMALNMGPSINGFWRNLLTFQVQRHPFHVASYTM
jgi:hypothetical protein